MDRNAECVAPPGLRRLDAEVPRAGALGYDFSRLRRSLW